MFDLQPSVSHLAFVHEPDWCVHLASSPFLDDASHAQVAQWGVNGQIEVGQRCRSADKQAAKGSSVDGLSAGGQSADEQSVWHGWSDARMQGILPPALSARIPLEVFELIVDAIRYQPRLAAMALVCHTTWYPRAMHNLYYSVELRSRTSYNMLFKQCHASLRFKQWLASTCELVVDEGKAEDTSMESPQYGNKSNHDTRFLQALPLALAALMPRVRILHTRNGGLRFIRTDFFLALSRYKSVKSLTLWHCLLNNITQLRRIVSAFPQLTNLTMHQVDFPQRGAASHAGSSLFQPSSRIRLRYLHVHMHGEVMAMFVDWMRRSGLCTSLADLTVQFNDLSMVQTSLNKLLETAGASLTRYRESTYSYNGHINLLQNTALRSWHPALPTIEYTAEDQGLRAAWTKAVYEFYSIFSTIRSRQLEHSRSTFPSTAAYYSSLSDPALSS
ncbi:uncharacterized protein B0H18DRAFT_254613 [Fomitopsis serialis]|uniref:uncharacterized protein n=1 Tax=Fomitopsis serialis TaxID=139415 RepID=UPI0020083B07|nr:uncharacterized protein B0H18DRAFT_254613 [Neoantrodia serialis]KAH9928318.1 hypothetical protein B0H18DRAFT_254613 [Neoantrodia serialis]